MNGAGPENAATYEQVGDITVVKLPKIPMSQEDCEGFAGQMGRLIDDGQCDFVVDFTNTEVISEPLLVHLFRLMKRAKAVAEQSGRRAAVPARPRGRLLNVFDDKAHAVEEMSRFDGHGWIVFCGMCPELREIIYTIR